MASLATIFQTKVVDFKSLAEEGYDIADLFESVGWLPFFEAIDCKWHEASVREFWNTTKMEEENKKIFLRAQVQGQDIIVNTAILEKVLGVKAEGAKFSDIWEDLHGGAGKFNKLIYGENGIKDIPKVLFEILKCCVIPSVRDNHISKMERFCVINLLERKKTNLPWVILFGMIRRERDFTEILPHNTIIMKLLQYYNVHIEYLYDHRRPSIFKVNGRNTMLNDALNKRPISEPVEVKRLKMENTFLRKELERTKTAFLKLKEDVGIKEEEENELSESQSFN